MYEEEVFAHNSQQLNELCYTCLSGTRKTVSLGEYAEIFNRIICFNVEDVQQLKICWECLAVLKKVKMFETKCYISQRILSTKWEDPHPPRCLSTLLITPVKIDIHSDGELNEKNFGLTYKDRPFVLVCSQTIDSVKSETYNNCIDSHSNDEYYCTKEENCSTEEQTDLRSDNEDYEDLKEEKVDNDDYLDHNDHGEIKESHVNEIEININYVSIETNDKMPINSIEASNGINTCNNSTDSSEEIKSNINNTISKVKLRNKKKGSELSEEIKSNINNTINKIKLRNKNTKSDRLQKVFEDHFRIVDFDKNNIKQFIVKSKMDPSELELRREMEKKLEFYIDQAYKCNNCIQGFSSLKIKSEHDKRYHDTSTPGYVCDVCSSQFRTIDNLSKHVSKHYERLACTLCHFRCLSRQAMKHHITRHRRLLMCAHCDSSFSNVRLFYKHFRSNHAVFICDHCGKKCRTKYTLEKHIIRHHSVKHICLICNKVYASRNSLRNHREMKHNVTSEEMAYCVKCDKQFVNTPLYLYHVRTSKSHAAERDADWTKKQVNCPVCGKVYSRKTYMMNHYRHVHTKQSKHYCVDCDKHFLNRTKYVDHRKYQHEGETRAKDKMCNICGKGFTAKTTLLNHIRTHSGERPYECEYCDAKFTQKIAMLSHIKYIHKKSKRRGVK